MKTVTSREFNQDVGKAKRAARLGPVFITDRGKPGHVLMSAEYYATITDQTSSIVELLYLPESEDIEFEPPRVFDTDIAPAELS